MSFLLFDYTGSAMKNTVYSFRPKIVVLQEPDLSSEKAKSCRTSNTNTVYYISLRFYTRVLLISAYKVFFSLCQ